MDRFTLDDAGEHFPEDIRAVLAPVGDRLLTVADGAAAAAADPAAPLGAIEDAFHTVSGSSALVGADALAGAANALGRLAVEARAVHGRMRAEARRLARLAEAARSVVPAMDGILAQEMSRDRDGALAASTALVAVVEAALAAAEPVIAERPVDDEPGFDFGEETVVAPVEPLASPPAADDDLLFTLIADDEISAPVTEPIVAPLPAAASTAAATTLAVAEAAIDPLLQEAFAQEAGELLDALDRQTLVLEATSDLAGCLRELFRGYHTLKGAANTVGLTAIGAAAHRAEDALESWDAATLAPRAAAAALLQVQRALRAAITGEAPAPAPEQVAAELARVSTVVADTRPPVGAPLPVAAVVEAGDARRSLRVASEQLDRLMRLAGELVITRARLTGRITALGETQRELSASRSRLVSTVDGFRARNEFTGLDGRRDGRGQFAGRGSQIDALFTDLELDRYEDIHVLARSLSEITGDIGELQTQVQRAMGEIGEDAEAIGRAVGGIQGEITRARMVPLEPLFTRLRLAADDAGTRLGRTVRVELAGTDTALDKAIVDGVQGALTHLIRNAVAHGIEPAAERSAAGKPEDGRIGIAARQEGGQILITVTDDGRGLDLPRLHRRGVERGLIDASVPVDSETVRNLVFAPGLSTSAATDAVSGRGIGCDAAREDVQRLGGTVGVASTTGAGTVFTLVLPLTLAISRAVLVRAVDQRFAVPMNFIERILDLEQERLSRAGGVRRVAYGGGEVRVVDLGAALGLREDDGAALGAALVVRLGERRWALRVDGLLRQEEVVVSGLGELLTGHPLFAGVTFAGGADLVPIIDLPGLLGAAPGPGRRTVAAAPMRPTRILTTAAPRRRRILFVDDSLSVRRVAEQQLAALGVEVVLAVDGEDALSRLRQGPVDLVFTDLEMPRMHGYDLLRELRYVPAHRDVPVVVVTSRSGDKHRALASQLGAVGYLTKPFTQDQLAEAIGRWAPAPRDIGA